MPKEKAPGPDGYIGSFFASCWDIIKIDLMAAIQHFYNLNSQNLHFLNQAYVVLIPKKDNPTKVCDYRPIIKKCIHDNFTYMQHVIRELHKKKIPALFIKLDIPKAFVSVNWPFLLEIMNFLSFGQRWRDWIANLWCTTSSCFLLNG